MEGMYRKAYDAMLKWKEDSNGSTALLIDGARRVGKSFLAEQFGKEYYKSYILIDFSDVSDDVKMFFRDSSEDIDFFFTRLSYYYGVDLHPRESLIILDEIQFFPYARQKIKQLVKDGRFDYIETGSLLSIKENTKDILIPSEERHMILRPMDFEEFLRAIGDTTTAPFLKMCFEKKMPLGADGHRKAMNLFRQYMMVGGMPAAVQQYVSTHDLKAVDEVKTAILDLYSADVTKFASNYKIFVKSVFNNIPSMLSRKEKKFRPGSITEDSRSRQYEEAFLWLEDAMIVNLCFNATDPEIGLRMYEDRATLKIYMADTGLLFTMAMKDREMEDEDFYRDIILDRMNVNEGMFTENVIAQTLVSRGIGLFFYSRYDKDNSENRMEIDFLVEIDGKICPVEVKSGNRVQHSSLDKFVKKFGRKIGQPYVLWTRDLREADGVVYLPLYMAMFLRSGPSAECEYGQDR